MTQREHRAAGGDNSAHDDHVIDLRNPSGDPFVYQVAARPRWSVRRWFFGLWGVRDAVWRMAIDVVILTIALTVAMVGHLGSPVHLWSQVGVVIGVPVLFSVAGVYRGSGPTSIESRIVRLGVACLVGLAIQLLATMATPLIPIVLTWVFGFVGTASARAAKARFADEYTIERRTGSSRSDPVRTVLLLGGAGYIGSTLIEQLLGKGYEVLVLDSLLFGDSAIADFYSSSAFELIEGDFRDVGTLVAALRRADAVIHLGAIVGDPACAIDAQATTDVNYRASRLVADACRGLGIRRLVFASTCSVYGAIDGIINESSALNPVSQYAASKIASERVILDHRTDSFQPTILRLGTAFGWARRPRFDLVVNLLAARAHSEGRITIINGHQWRPFVHVDDIARAFVAALEAPLSVVGGQVFNVGDDRLNMTLDQLGNTIAEVFPDVAVERIMKDDDPRSYQVSFAKINAALGFRCETTLEKGVRDIAHEIREIDAFDYTESVYSNVKSLSQNPALLELPQDPFQSIVVGFDPTRADLEPVPETA